MSTVHDFSAKDIDGKDIALGEHRGKVLLVVKHDCKCLLA